VQAGTDLLDQVIIILTDQIVRLLVKQPLVEVKAVITQPVVERAVVRAVAAFIIQAAVQGLPDKEILAEQDLITQRTIQVGAAAELAVLVLQLLRQRKQVLAVLVYILL
jgi:hypothetical protein